MLNLFKELDIERALTQTFILGAAFGVFFSIMLVIIVAVLTSIF